MLTQFELTGTYDEVPLGAEESFVRSVDPSSIDQFAQAVQSFHPLHMDAEWAKANSKFDNRVAHGLMTSALVSRPIVNFIQRFKLNTLLISTTSKYVRAVVAGDTITTRLCLVEKIESRQRLRFEVTSTNQRGEVVLVGEAVEQVL